MADKTKRDSTKKAASSAGSTARTKKSGGKFSDAEKAAMKERAAELKKQAKGGKKGAMLDDGDIWPTAYAITTLTPAVERKIGELLERAAR